MPSENGSRKSVKTFRWSLFSFPRRPRQPEEIKAELRRLDQYEPAAEMGEGERRKLLEQKELARLALLDELRGAEYLRGKPWLVRAPIIFRAAAVATAVLIWLLVRSRP